MAPGKSHNIGTSIIAKIFTSLMINYMTSNTFKVKATRDVKDFVTILVKHVIRIYIQG